MRRCVWLRFSDQEEMLNNRNSLGNQNFALESEFFDGTVDGVK